MPFPYFIEEYLRFNAGNEVPKTYHIWSALVILAAAVHKRVYVPYGYYTTYPNLYVGLIGSMGSRKSSGKDIASDLFQETFPDYPVLSSVQSREDIIKYMNSDACHFVFNNHEGTEITVRPIVGFINELKNFLSVDPGKMIEFLTDIYSGKRFKSSTIKRGLEDLENPCINLLCCETPEWITEKLKGGLISGGWSRRIIYVYERERGTPIAFPELPPGHAIMWNNLKKHLEKVSRIVGPFSWEPDAREWYTKWYEKMRTNMPEDKLMAGYYESKHDQLMKVCIGFALAEEEPQLRITVPHLILACGILDALEENMPRLWSAAGRNALTVPMQEALDKLKNVGGIVPEKALRREMGKDMAPMEILQTLRFLQDTDQLVVKTMKVDGVVREMAMLPEKYIELKKKGLIV